MASRVTLNNELIFPSDYLAAIEFRGRDVTLTIAKIFKDELKMRGGKSEQKYVLSFRETKKKLVLNKTNADSIAQMYGAEAGAWIGKRVTFYPTKTQCGRETVDCIRVREVVPASKPQPTQNTQQSPPPADDEPGFDPSTGEVMDTPFDGPEDQGQGAATSEPSTIEKAVILYSEKHGVTPPAAQARIEDYAKSLFNAALDELTEAQASDVYLKVKKGEIAPVAAPKKGK